MLEARSRHRHPALRLIATLTLTTLISLALPVAVAADAWAGVRNCQNANTCKVASQATGNVQHQRCAADGSNCVLKAAWANGGTFTWRTSFHGSGNQMALISTNLSLASQSATCVCLNPPCPV